jgi:hypothetical protein
MNDRKLTVKMKKLRSKLMTADFEIGVLAARDLPRPTPHTSQRPYCNLQVDGVADTLQTQAGHTATDPQWDQQFPFKDLEISSPSIAIRLTVLHKNRVIGQTSLTLKLDDIDHQGGLDEWFPLKTEDEKTDAGNVHIAVKVQALRVPRSGRDSRAEADDGQLTNPGSPGKGSRLLPLESPSPGTKAARLRLQIDNDGGDRTEIQQKAEAGAAKMYQAYLDRRTPLLMGNQELVKKYHAELANG